MRKTLTSALFLLAAGMMLPGIVLAQQTPAATTQTPTLSAPVPQSPAAPAFPNPVDKFSYALGMSIGGNLHRQSVAVNPDLFAQGLKDAVSGGKTLLTDEEARATVTEMQNQVRKEQQAKAAQEAEANKKEGETFLAQNKSKEGVVATASGLQYKILTAGTGPKPTAADSVVCNYRGTLISGKEFDSSYKRGQPATFPVSGVIKGWTEALQLMPVGSKWQLFVPSDLAYGDRAMGADIAPGSTLIFEVELLSIEKKGSDTPDKK
jgi:FKBP-type peptidyl-prolyl cis-trans isomerase